MQWLVVLSLIFIALASSATPGSKSTGVVRIIAFHMCAFTILTLKS